MDAFAGRSKTEVWATLNQKFKKEEREVRQQTAPFFLFNTGAIPLMIILNSYHGWKMSKYGIKLESPSYHEIRMKYLSKNMTNALMQWPCLKSRWMEW